jgi:hypothetical protein
MRPDDDIPEAEPVPPRRPRRPLVDPSMGEELPRIVRAAREAVDGPEPTSVTLARADDGAVVWHVVFWTNDGSREVQVALDGIVRSDTAVTPPVVVPPEDL